MKTMDQYLEGARAGGRHREHAAWAGAYLYNAWVHGDLHNKRTVLMRIVEDACRYAREVEQRSEADILAMRHALASQLCQEHDDRVMASVRNR